MLPFSGIKVIDATQNAAGPMAGRWLADWGADVIHLEHPVRGDPVRSRFFRRYNDMDIDSDFNYAFENINRNKRGITLDMASPGGKKVLRKLIDGADVFLTNYRTSDLEKFDCRYEDLKTINPRLVYASVTGFGKFGPDANTPGYDATAFMTRAGPADAFRWYPEQVPPPWTTAFGDFYTALGIAMGIVTALWTREKTGRGQEVTTSLYNMGVYAMSYDIAAALLLKREMPMRQEVKDALEKQKGGNIDLRHTRVTPLINYYRTKDNRWLTLSITQPDRYWPWVCQSIGREDLINDVRYNTLKVQMENHVEIVRILDEAFQGRTLAEWKERLDAAGVIWAPAQNFVEIIRDPQARANGFFTTFDHPSYGPVELVDCPVKLSDTPAQITKPAPELGQHTEEVLLEAGYNWEEIIKLKEDGIIA